MTQIMVIEPEEIVVTALKKTFENDDDIKLKFVENFTAAAEILNGNPKNKDVFEKFKAVYEEAKKEFEEAAAKEITAKAVSDNSSEILEKYRSELTALVNPDTSLKKNASVSADEKPATAVTTEETPQELDARKQSLENGIERLSSELKNQKELLLAATKLKTEKEKIALEKQIIAEKAQAEIPATADQVFSVLMISSKLLLPDVTQWLENFKKTITFESNKDIKIIVLGFEFDEKSVKKYLNPRISDYMIKPVDELLARQNIKFLAATDKKSKREVYSLKIQAPVDLVFEYELESLSEFSFSIKSQEKFVISEFKIFSSELFLRKGQQSVIGKCLSSTDLSGGQFSSEFWFVGMDTHLAFQIRNVIKNAPKI